MPDRPPRPSILDRWHAVQPLLDELLELDPPLRQARIAELARHDPALGPLLAALDDDAGVAQRFAPLPAAIGGAFLGGELPEAVGDYRILGELGRGGMARVFLAERAGTPPGPRVAVKVVDAGPGLPQIARRFERERETLARLRHPHIARWIDGGVTAQGDAYLVMEFVDGQPIDRHCDDRRLTIEARLRLFGDVCAAVAYAHGQLVVHRDVKPSNVLVDERGTVKLLDFGIAKWLAALEGESLSQTTTQHRALTPSHAAPEQFLQEATTTTTDVYQLGLLLFELLTGRRAHVAGDAVALRRAVVAGEVDRPSAVAAGRAAGPVPPEEVRRRAHDRATTPGGLARALAGDLDAIALKALSREPADRYATVDALRQDIDAVLTHRPVAARRGSTLATTAKFVRRHRVAVAAAVGVVASGVIGLGAFLGQARAAALERDRAVAAEARTAAINAFLVEELLTAATPEKAQGRPLGVDQVLANAARSVGPALGDQPDVEAAVRRTLARSYAALGQLTPARTQAEASAAILARTVPADDPARLQSRAVLAERLLDEGRFADAQATLPDLVRIQTARLGPSHPDTITSRALLGRALRLAGQETAAATELHAAAAAAEQLAAADWRVKARVWSELVRVQLDMAQALDAERLSRRLVALTRARRGADHPDVADALAQLARALTALLDYRAAIDASADVLAVHTRLYGPDHPNTGRAHLWLAIAHSRFQEDQKAIDETRLAYDILARSLGPEHPDTVMALRNLGVTQRYAGNLAGAEESYRRVLAIRQRTLGRWHRDSLEAAALVQTNVATQGRAAEARRLGRDLIAQYETAIRAADPDPLVLDAFAGLLLDIAPSDLRQPARAVELAEHAVRATAGRDYARLRTLADAQVAAGRPRDALATVRTALALPQAIQSWSLEATMVRLLREHAPQDVEPWLLARLAQFTRLRRSDDFLAGHTLRHLAAECERQGRVDDAEQRYRDALAQFRRHAPESHFQILRVKSDLGALLTGRGRAGEAEPLLRAAFDGLTADPVVAAEHKSRVRARLAAVYVALGRPGDAARYLPEAPRPTR